MISPVVMYGCVSWTIKAEHQRTDAFELWCWRRLLRVPWTARRSSQSILKEIDPEYSLGGLMLKLKLQYFGHLMRRANSLEKTLMLGKIEGKRKRGCDGWMASLTQHTWVWASSRSWWWTGKPGVLHSLGMQRVGQDWVTEQQQRDTSTWCKPNRLHRSRKDSGGTLQAQWALKQSPSHGKQCLFSAKPCHPPHKANVFHWNLLLFCLSMVLVVWFCNSYKHKGVKLAFKFLCV